MVERSDTGGETLRRRHTPSTDSPRERSPWDCRVRTPNHSRLFEQFQNFAPSDQDIPKTVSTIPYFTLLPERTVRLCGNLSIDVTYEVLLKTGGWH